MGFINNFLNQITMYRLMVWILRSFIGIAVILSFFGILPYNPIAILVSAAFLVSVCWVANKIFSAIFNAPTNVESYNITALILCLIITPALSPNNLLFMTFAGIFAMGSKYILAINKKHVFNPAAIGVVASYFLINQGASWWVGDFPLIPLTLVLGLLIVKKIQRFDLVLSFLMVSTASILLFDILNKVDIKTSLDVLYLHSPLIFFSIIMLTEPYTTPPTRFLRIVYGTFVGLLFYPQIHIGNIYMLPEMALVIGNILSFLVSPKYSFLPNLLSKTKIAPDTWDFSFVKPTNFSFSPGQYLEWTLPHPNTDSRGNRRYFSIASSPTEEILKIGVKVTDNGSSFKGRFKNLEKGDTVAAGQLRGDFTLPKSHIGSVIFLAGGIGITPYRSMIKYLVDRGENRNVTLVYSNKTESEIVYKELFDEAEKKVGLKTIYTLTDEKNLPKDWKGSVGRVSEDMIKRIPDYESAIYYLSGPHSLVKGFEAILKDLKIPKRQIKIDFFPGYV